MSPARTNFAHGWVERPPEHGEPAHHDHLRGRQGALRDVWREVLAASADDAPPVSVLLLPDVLASLWERMGLDQHLSLAAIAAAIWARARLQALHPAVQAANIEEPEIEVAAAPPLRPLRSRSVLAHHRCGQRVWTMPRR